MRGVCCLLVAGHSVAHTFILRVDNHTHAPEERCVCPHPFLYAYVCLLGPSCHCCETFLAGPHNFTVLFEGWVGGRLGFGVAVRSGLR